MNMRPSPTEHGALCAATALATVAVVPLRHLGDCETPGITRRRAGRGFSYRLADGSLLRDTAELARIRQLAIPPT